MYNTDNIFFKILSGEIKADKLYEDDLVLAIHDVAPVAPIHVLIIPKKNYLDYDDFISTAPSDEIVHYFTKIKEIAESLDLKQEGYRLITNIGSRAGQTIFHFHTHIIGGKIMSSLL